MKKFFKCLFWLVVAAAAVVGAWFAFDGCKEDVVETPVVEVVDVVEIEVEETEIEETNVELNTVETNE